MRESEPYFEGDKSEATLFNEEEFLKTVEIQEKKPYQKKG